jgi:hypothetical protein
MADHGHVSRFATLAIVIAESEIIADHVSIYHDSSDSGTIEWKSAKRRPRTGIGPWELQRRLRRYFERSAVQLSPPQICATENFAQELA